MNRRGWSLLVPYVIVCSLISVLTHPQPAPSAESPKQMLILPFAIHASEDMAYMETAVMDMLSSRLEKPGQIRVVKGTESTREASRCQALMVQHQADYLVTGSMTLFGDEVSIDASMYAAGNPSPTVVFHEYGKTSDGVLSHIEKLAQTIESQALVSSSQAPASDIEKRKDTKPLPEEDYAWHSQKLNFRVIGLSAGDLDGDGILEWILAGEKAVYIYSRQDDRLILKAELVQKKKSILGVDVIDLDGNQRAEIFITCKRGGSRLDTSVLEWNGHAYQALQHGLKWYFRTVSDFKKNQRGLLGQKQGNVSGFRTGSAGADLFEAGIFRFQKKNGAYIPETALVIPEDVNIYWIGFGDVMGTGSSQSLVFGRKDYLSLISDDETVEWHSPEPYGGSDLYLETSTNDNLNETDRQYLAQRIHVADLNGDGDGEVIVPRNHDAGGRLFRKFRNYNKGAIHVLSWRNATLETIWESAEISGYISDTWMVDVTRDHRPEVAYCVVSRSGVLSGDYASRLYIQELPIGDR